MQEEEQPTVDEMPVETQVEYSEYLEGLFDD